MDLPAYHPWGIRLSYSVFCLLSSTQHAYPALLVPCALIFFVPLCLRGQDPRSTNHPFFCKTNPISKTPKPTQPLFPQRFTPVLRSAPPPKTNPNEPNVKVGKMNISIAAVKPYANEQRPMNNERYSKQTQFKPKTRALLDPKRSRRANQTQFHFQPFSPLIAAKKRYNVVYGKSG